VTIERAGFFDWLRLQLLLGGIVLAVAAVRTAEMAQVLGMSFGSPSWSRLLAVEAAIWLGWTLWAGVVVLLVRRVVERAPIRVHRMAALVILSIAPVLIVPVVASPVHWSVFGAGPRWAEPTCTWCGTTP
jgi:hypothetical protein